MPNILATSLILLVAILGGLYQIYVHPILKVWGAFSEASNIGTRDCITVPELQACEKMVLHQPSGFLYLACSTRNSRLQWFARETINFTARSEPDYLATYDPASLTIKRLKFSKFNMKDTVAVHGMDVVPSDRDPNKLFIYLVNHRMPEGDPVKVGLDSVVELFETTVGGDTLEHIKTFKDPSVIITPNDLVGSPDGKSFYFTNDHAHRATTPVQVVMGAFIPSTSIGYCHIDKGCKISIKSLPTNNGIVRAKNGTFYLASVLNGGFRILEEQSDNTLVVTETVPTKYGMDNLSIDSNGAVWAASFPKMLVMDQHMKDYNILSPTAVLRLTINTGPNRFYGEKYKVDTVFEDTGNLTSGTTTVAHDAERGRLFIHGLISPWLTVCKV